jgi:hypothetical protein
MAGVQVSVPSDRVSKVASVEGSGTACSGKVIDDDGGAFQIPVVAEGVCHVVVTFQSGPPYTDDVNLRPPCHGAACCACGPYPDHAVVVPEEGA